MASKKGERQTGDFPRTYHASFIPPSLPSPLAPRQFGLEKKKKFPPPLRPPPLFHI